MANFTTGPGLLSLMADTGSEIDVLWALDTSVVQTQPGEQTGRALLCASATGSPATYQCSLTPTLGAYVAGMTLHWKPDVNGGGGPTTLNIDTLGAMPIRLRDGVSDPARQTFLAGALYDIWYDGTQFRLMTPMPSMASGSVVSVFAGRERLLNRPETTPPIRSRRGRPQILHRRPRSGRDGRPISDAHLRSAIELANAGDGGGHASTDFEPALGNPSVSGYVLSSNTAGARSWVAQSGGVASAFGRTGAVTAHSGDYTTDQVTEGGNFTIQTNGH